MDRQHERRAGDERREPNERRAPWVLRKLAALLIRGPEASFIRRDVDDLLARDIGRGMSRRRALGRYAGNLAGSAANAWWRRLRLPRSTGMSWLDVKLGGRMLVKYPGLTLVGGSAMAFAIAIGACVFVIINQVVYPSMPLDEGGRVVGIVNWDAETGQPERRSLHDFVTWHNEVRSIEDLGAARLMGRNLIIDGQPSAPLQVAEISAAAFRVARVPALLGRPLQEEDERIGEPAVVVIGYDVWRARFASDPDVVGRVVQLGNTATTIVGVMPAGFAFPIAHNAWIPLRRNVPAHPPRDGPPVHVFGRLAAAVTLDEAQVELAAIGERTAVDFPETHQPLRPRVLPYARSIVDLPAAMSVALYSFNLLAVMFVVLVCANVALLVYARTATRRAEIVIRSALGAGRGRIIAQLFAEALVLGAVASAVGLAVAGFGARWAVSTFATVEDMVIPFWFDVGVTGATVLYAGVLTVLGAAVAGVLPGLKATGRRAQARMQQAVTGGPSVRFGGVWTAVIVTQVAVTVVFVPIVVFTAFDIAEIRSTELGFPADEYLSARLRIDEDTAERFGREATGRASDELQTAYRELERRLLGEPGVSAVTFASVFPGAYHPRRWVEIEGDTEPPVYGAGHRPQGISVDVGFFEALGKPIVAGRGFRSGDLESGAPPVIVNESFVRDILGGRNPIGRRLRYLNRGEPEGPWYEIVGVVEQLAMTIDPDLRTAAGFYHPTRPAGVRSLKIAVHVGGDPMAFAPRLRTLAADVDPLLRLDQLLPLHESAWATRQTYEFWFQVAAVAIGIALLLSLAGIYAIMSFTVSQRTREIGVRVALGAAQFDIVRAVLARSMAQVGAGVIVGAIMIVGLIVLTSDNGIGLSPRGLVFLLLHAVIMMGVCMLAAIVPTRRALRVQPTEALRAD